MEKYKPSELIKECVDIGEPHAKELAKSLILKHGKHVPTEIADDFLDVYSRFLDKVRPYRLQSGKQVFYTRQMLYNSWIGKQVIKIRKAVFDCETAPFPNDYDNAIKWIEEESDKFRLQENKLKYNLFLEKVQEIRNLIDKGEIIGDNLIIKPIPSTYKVVKEKGHDASYTAWIEHSPILKKLFTMIDDIQYLSGINQYDFLKLVLSDEMPQIFSYECYYTHTYPTKIVSIQLNAEFLTQENLYDVYITLREKLNIKKKRNLTDKQKRLLNMAEHFGTPPLAEEGKNTGKKAAYYKTMFEAWNKEYPNEQFKTYKRIQKAHEDALGVVRTPRKEKTPE